MRYLVGHAPENAAKLARHFWERVDVRGPEDCWLWLGGKFDYGYGCFWIGKSVHAHRYAWELLVGPIPADLTLDHFRLNPGPRQAPCSRACVNPARLEAVTVRENTLRGNTLPALNVTKTHCPKGHPYDYVQTWGGRACRTCNRKSQRESARRKRAALREAAAAAKVRLVEIPA